MPKHKQNRDGQKKKHSKKFANEYNGYYPEQDAPDTIQLTDIKPRQFYNDYVKLRKPVIIDGQIGDLDTRAFQPDRIVSRLHTDDQMLLVEKKHQGGFGSGTERVKMTFKDFMEKLKEEGDNYYLTTQYVEDDPDEMNKTLEKLQRDIADDDNDDDLDSEDYDETPLPVEGDEDDDSEIEEDQFAPPLANSGTFSDTDSIDFNDIHDDFDELDNNASSGEENISTDVPGGPLTSDEAHRRVHEFVQKPLTNLVETADLPLQPELLSKLTPQQINIWIGKSTSDSNYKFEIDTNKSDYGLGRRVFGGGVSSGLHHDHADNLYVPICGSKRFTIFAPSDAEKMYTVGDINRVYASGVIDYKNNANAPGWRALRDDSAIITEVAKWRLDNDEDLTEKERQCFIQLIEKEEEVLQDFETKVVDQGGVKKDPPSFSKVPASILHLDKITDNELRKKLEEFAHETWPKFFQSKRMTVNLKPGQMFFLPAGWFHEVTSFGSATNNDNIHIALNYWYSPPNHAENVYSDDYWSQDFARTLESCKHFG